MQNQFQTLIEKIEKLELSPKTSKRDKSKLKKARQLLLGTDNYKWVEAFEILGSIMTKSNTLIHVLVSIWGWLKTLFDTL